MTSTVQPPTRKRPSYHSTEVSATDSREEILKLLNRPDLSINDVRWVALGGRKSRLYFRIEGRLHKIDIQVSDDEKDPDRRFRRRHRAVVHLLKNIIAVADEGLYTLPEVMATYLLTSDENVTVGEALLRLEAGSSRSITLELAPAEPALAPTTPTGVAPKKPRDR